LDVFVSVRDQAPVGGIAGDFESLQTRTARRRSDDRVHQFVQTFGKVSLEQFAVSLVGTCVCAGFVVVVFARCFVGIGSATTIAIAIVGVHQVLEN
jgi:hypothetical protein